MTLARIPPVVLAAGAVVVLALVVGAALAERSAPAAQPQTTPPLTSASPVTTPFVSTPEGTQPPLNGLEVKVINALGKLGVTGVRAQLPYRDASIWADLGTGSQLFVSAYPLGTVDRNYTVIDERHVAGIGIQHVRRPTDPAIRSRFECAADEYWVRGAVPAGFTDMDAFVERFITALACSP